MTQEERNLSAHNEVAVLLGNKWSGEGLPSLWSKFAEGMISGPGRARDDVIAYARELVDLAGGQNIALLAITEELLSHIAEVTGKPGTTMTGWDAVQDFQQTKGPQAPSDQTQTYNSACDSWREEVTAALKVRYSPDSPAFRPRVSRAELAAAYGFICALNSDPRKLPPLGDPNNTALQIKSLDYFATMTGVII